MNEFEALATDHEFLVSAIWQGHSQSNLAAELARALGGPEELWLRREAQYREQLEKLKGGSNGPGNQSPAEGS